MKEVIIGEMIFIDNVIYFEFLIVSLAVKVLEITGADMSKSDITIFKKVRVIW